MSNQWLATLSRKLRSTLAATLALAVSLVIPAFAHAGQATLAWDPSSDSRVTGYTVYYGSNSRSYSGKINAGKSTSYTVRNLASGKKYYFAVTAYNSAGIESSFSNEASATIPAAAPVASNSAGSGGAPKTTGGNAAIKPTASFVATATSGKAPLATVFSSTSTGSISTYAWNFGDGTTAAGATVRKTYSAAGTYTVTLTITGSGGSSSSSKTIWVTGVTTKPTASFSATATSGAAPLATVFTSTSTGSIAAYSWNFGDGTSAAGATVSKTYHAAGTYTATLTVTGPAGSSSSSKAVTVTAPGSSMTAGFSANRVTGPAPLAVRFTDASTGSISSYAWRFGDGGASTLRNPTHTYSSPGVYSVTLTVSGSGGSKSITKSGFIKIGLDNDLVVDFGVGDGIWQFLNNGTWSRVHTSNAKSVTLADMDHNGHTDKVVDFGSQFGIWMQKNDGAWTRLHSWSATWVSAVDLDDNGEDDLLVDFGAGRGIWGYYNGNSWKQIIELSSRRAIVADVDHNGRDDVVVDYGGAYGLWAYMNGVNWKWLDRRSPDWLAKVDLDDNGQDDLAMSFGAGTGSAQVHPGRGVWALLNGANWKQIDARAIASTRGLGADIDHSGRDDLVVDYGGNGLWVLKNNSTWSQLHSASAKSLAQADLDSNQQADLVVDFGSRYGIYALMNGQTWKQIHATSASTVSAGQIDAR